MEAVSKKTYIPSYNQFAIAIILILHSVGLFQIIINDRSELMESSHIIILITSVLCIIPEINNSIRILIPFSLVFLIGLFIEVIGVNTGYLFGDYTYSDSLGLKIMNTPIIIGLLWLSLSVGIQSLLKQTPLKKWVIISLGGLFMMLFDILLEPVAIHYDLWQWTAPSVPLYNYFCWFVFAFIMQIILFDFTSKKGLFKYSFIVNFIFFLTLTLAK